MVLGGTKPRGVAEDPDKVLTSAGWVLLLAAAAFLVVVGFLFALAGAFAPLGDGEERSWLPVVLGVLLVGFGVGLAVVLWGPRPGDEPPPATAAPGGGVTLPLRRAQQTTTASGFVVIAAMGLLMATISDGPAPLALGVFIFLLGAAMCVLHLRAIRRGAGAIVLTPESVRLPAGTTPATTVAWDDLSEFVAVGGWQPHLVVTYRGPGMATAPLRGQAWPPGPLLQLLEHYRTNPRDRAELTSPAAIDRFRR